MPVQRISVVFTVQPAGAVTVIEAGLPASGMTAVRPDWARSLVMTTSAVPVSPGDTVAGTVVIDTCWSNGVPT